VLKLRRRKIMIKRLEGNNPYEMVSNATGDLAMKLMGLISTYAEDARVFDLANEFIEWWYIPFNDPGKDAVGKSIWDKADSLKALLDAAAPMTRLERAGDAVGAAIGKTAGITANVTIAGATATHRWMRGSAAPAIRVGGKEFWKGLKATARATRETYRDARSDKDSLI